MNSSWYLVKRSHSKIERSFLHVLLKEPFGDTCGSRGEPARPGDILVPREPNSPGPTSAAAGPGWSHLSLPAGEGNLRLELELETRMTWI